MTSQPPVREGAQPRRLPTQHWTTDLHATPFIQPRSTDKRPSGAPSSPGSPVSPSTPILPTSLALGSAQVGPRDPPHPSSTQIHPDPERKFPPTHSQPPNMPKTLKRGLAHPGVTCCPPANTILPSSSWLAKPAGGPRDLRSTHTHGARGDWGDLAREISGWGLWARQTGPGARALRASSFNGPPGLF